MKEIKAYMREFKAEEVINCLEEAGVPGITVIKMQSTGKNIAEDARYSIEYCEKVSAIAKIEVVEDRLYRSQRRWNDLYIQRRACH